MYNPTINPMPIGPVVVAAAGTPVPLVSELITLGILLAGDWLQANKLFLLPLPTNNGNVYVGQKGMNKATGAGVMFAFGPGVGSGFTLINNVGLNIYRADQFFVDADNSGEGLYGSIDQV